jgi:hypothetical protein
MLPGRRLNASPAICDIVTLIAPGPFPPAARDGTGSHTVPSLSFWGHRNHLRGCLCVGATRKRQALKSLRADGMWTAAGTS